MSECKYRGWIRASKIFMCAKDGIQKAHSCPDWHFEDCQVKQEGSFMGWHESAKEDFAGKYLKFSTETPEHTVTFEGEPEIRELQSTFKKGEVYKSYDFPVSVGGKSRILGVTQKSLIELIIEEDEEESIIGRTFRIKCLGEGKNKSWKMREVPPEKFATQAEVTDKEKFMAGVEKQKAKRKAKASTVSPDEEGKGLVDLGSQGADEVGQEQTE